MIRKLIFSNCYFVIFVTFVVQRMFDCGCSPARCASYGEILLHLRHVELAAGLFQKAIIDHLGNRERLRHL
jgi:hypothetical protein